MAAVPVPVRVLGAFFGGRVVHRSVRPLDKRIADMSGHGATRAVETALLDPRAESGDGRDVSVVRDRRRLRDRIRLHR